MALYISICGGDKSGDDDLPGIDRVCAVTKGGNKWNDPALLPTRPGR